VVVQVVLELRSVTETRFAQLANGASRQHGIAVPDMTVDVLDERRLIIGRQSAVRTRFLNRRRQAGDGGGGGHRFPVRAAPVIRPDMYRLRRCHRGGFGAVAVVVDEGAIVVADAAAELCRLYWCEHTADAEFVRLDVRPERKL